MRMVCRPDEVRGFAERMLGATLITHQTGPAGQRCQKVGARGLALHTWRLAPLTACMDVHARQVLVNEGISIEKEFYLAILMDRAHNGPCIVASAQGGMDIEAVAAKDPSAIVVVRRAAASRARVACALTRHCMQEPVDITSGPTSEQTARVAKALGFAEGDRNFGMAQEQMQALYKMFLDTDATQVEINPFAIGSVPGRVQSSGAPRSCPRRARCPRAHAAICRRAVPLPQCSAWTPS